jgi:hypothetical protein
MVSVERGLIDGVTVGTCLISGNLGANGTIGTEGIKDDGTVGTEILGWVSSLLNNTFCLFLCNN